ncbi:hypothetical protein AGMMS49525_04830 [Bacteroidia bacterium]|nr:hypothetical protein AGMMS49525_04830 [Bacteroidia bacterium]
MSKNNKILNGFEPEKLDMKELNNIEDVEQVLELEAKKLLKAKQQKQMSDMRCQQYYCNIVFANKFDRDKFLSNIQDVDIMGDTFIDGYELAKKMGFEIEMTASLPKPHYVKQLKIKKDGINRKR